MYRCNAVNFEFLKEVDGAVFSYREKIIKPDPAIYQLILDRYGLDGSETLFLDDRPVNVEGARSMGICSEQADSFETIKKALEKYEIRI